MVLVNIQIKWKMKTNHTVEMVFHIDNQSYYKNIII